MAGNIRTRCLKNQTDRSPASTCRLHRTAKWSTVRDTRSIRRTIETPARVAEARGKLGRCFKYSPHWGQVGRLAWPMGTNLAKGRNRRQFPNRSIRRDDLLKFREFAGRFAGLWIVKIVPGRPGIPRPPVYRLQPPSRGRFFVLALSKPDRHGGLCTSHRQLPYFVNHLSVPP